MKKTAPWILWSLPLVAGVLFFGLWIGLRTATGLSSWILPTPAEVLEAAWTERITLLAAVRATAVGALGGFATAALTGLGLGLVLGASRWLHAALYPWLLVLQMTPVIVLAPLIVLWAGPGMPGIITVTWLISFFPIVASTTHGLVSTDRNLVALFRVANARRTQEMRWLRLPSALPHYLTGLRIAATLAPVGAIFGEYLVGSSAGGSGGLGFLVYSYNTQIKIPALFATALTSCLLGFAFVAAVALVNWLALRRWHDSFQHDDH